MSEPLPSGAKVTSTFLRDKKRSAGSDPIVMITAYDTPGAQMADQAGVDAILVGDSVANNVLGYRDTLAVDGDVMVHHTAAVARAGTRALLVADLPWMSYHVDGPDTVRNAARLVRAGAEAVKLEGGSVRLPMIEALIAAEIPVMGHLGLTPQSVHALGGFKVQGKDDPAIDLLLADARAVADAGCFAIVLEAVPDAVAEAITNIVDIPPIGIGAGSACDGQVLVFHDLLGLGSDRVPKFVRRYADLRNETVDAIGRLAADVRGGTFPSDAESYHLPKGAGERFAG